MASSTTSRSSSGVTQPAHISSAPVATAFCGVFWRRAGAWRAAAAGRTCSVACTLTAALQRGKSNRMLARRIGRWSGSTSGGSIGSG
eukprot:5368296-Prymnesium_polylepis.1